MNPLSTSLLLTMRHGRTYTAANLARLLGASMDTVNEALCELVAHGSVGLRDNGLKAMGYCRNEAGETPSAQQYTDSPLAATSIATFPVTRKLEGSLSGYDSAIQQHRNLAMLARR